MDTKKWISLAAALCVAIALSLLLPSTAFAQTCGLVANSGFESNLTGWAGTGPVSIVSDAHSGTKAARIGTAQGGVNGSGNFPVSAGQSLTFQVWAKVTGNPSWAGVGLDFLNAAGAEVSEINTPVTGGTYALRSTTRTVPTGAVAARIWTWKSGSTGYLFLDDVCVTVPDSQAPSVPAGLSSASPGTGSFTLRWNAATDNVAVTGYEVFRGGVSIGSTTATSFNVTGLASATTYAMRVRARDAAGNWSAQSATLSVTTAGATASYDITIDKSARNQTIDGFGFFGAQNNWWAGSSSLWSDAWGDQVISDLGITIWRNEHYPPSDSLDTQDANWTKQLPVVRGLKRKADQYGVNLKFIFTVWSPPASMKVQVDDNTRLIGVPHPSGTKQGGALDPTKYGEFAAWMGQGIDQYRAEGIEPYAVSPQNEPFFVQGFNSCWYKQEWYPEMLIGAMSILKANYPNVKVFGSEGMLEMEAADNNWQWFYHKQILDSPAARANVDILAVHGYSDGVAPTSGSTLGHLWQSHKQHFADPMNKKEWMTETSGYQDAWNGSPGAFALGLDIISALNNGNLAGWVWWQGSENPGSTAGVGEFALMNGAVKGKKYFVSKQFYRYIRPGAVRVGATSANNNVFVSAYEHAGAGTHTIVLANTATTSQTVTLGGAGLPASFTIYRTSATEDSVNAGDYATGTPLALPARSITTLQAGGTPLATTPGN
ncbi:MAG TPA: glycoside hydrolase family 30 beta sandwich domain-containing protein [Steroidobacteraceae bacterium]|jgi:O-glycosyl hydrolase|nr:glycoside hydrolase family 30 beta sandwich domain-containing protein [Steroidobacteraceae bacterium]